VSSQGAIWIDVDCSEAAILIQAGSISYDIGRGSSDAECTWLGCLKDQFEQFQTK